MTLVKKPTVYQLLSFFTQLKIAWSSTRDLFHNGHARGYGSIDDKRVSQIVMELLDFFIPVVSVFVFFQKHINQTEPVTFTVIRFLLG